MQIIIPFKTPTVNHLYTRNRFGNQCKTGEANKLKKEINEIVEERTHHEAIYYNQKLKVTIEIHEDWYCKNLSVKKKDIANREKFLVDAIFDSLGLDDKFIFEESIKKIQSDEEKAIINIEVLEG